LQKCKLFFRKQIVVVQIALNEGRIALIDEEDFEKVSRYQWNVVHGRTTFYAYTVTEYRRMVSMHRMILGRTDGRLIDHKNGNGLDNTRQNIRPATASQNQQNAKKQRRPNSTSRFKGVRLAKDKKGKKRWQAQIHPVHGKRISLKYHASEEEAARAYDRAARELFGEFARLNFE
jgi:hypothetical protein